MCVSWLNVLLSGVCVFQAQPAQSQSDGGPSDLGAPPSAPLQPERRVGGRLRRAPQRVGQAGDAALGQDDG